MKNEIINLDTPEARRFGFTSDKYESTSYLWEEGDSIFISFIHCKEHGRGFLSQLFNAIEKEGYFIIVPTPLARMEVILKAKNFKPYWKYDSRYSDFVELWTRPNPTWPLFWRS